MDEPMSCLGHLRHFDRLIAHRGPGLLLLRDYTLSLLTGQGVTVHGNKVAICYLNQYGFSILFDMAWVNLIVLSKYSCGRRASHSPGRLPYEGARFLGGITKRVGDVNGKLLWVSLRTYCHFAGGAKKRLLTSHDSHPRKIKNDYSEGLSAEDVSSCHCLEIVISSLACSWMVLSNIDWHDPWSVHSHVHWCVQWWCWQICSRLLRHSHLPYHAQWHTRWRPSFRFRWGLLIMFIIVYCDIVCWQVWDIHLKNWNNIETDVRNEKVVIACHA